MYNMDRLYQAVAEKGHVCVGLDTAPEYLPPAELRRAGEAAEAILRYNLALIEATADIAACYKVQIAYYEELGLPGLRAYAETLRAIKARGALSIADIKRGDIADTALRYARAHFTGEFAADFVTLSPLMGMDTLDPWLSVGEPLGKGAFVLTRTSNPGMKDFLYPEIKAGGRLYEAIGGRLMDLAAEKRGDHGYGLFGAVVGADPKSREERLETLALRRKYDRLFFLIPGYGAQGGGGDDAALLLHQGNGGVVNASRSILKAWLSPAVLGEKAPESISLSFAAEAARSAAITMRDTILASAAKNPEDIAEGAHGN